MGDHALHVLPPYTDRAVETELSLQTIICQELQERMNKYRWGTTP